MNAIKIVLTGRHKPNNPEHKDLLFISAKGESFICSNSGYRVAKLLLYYLDKAKLRRPGLTFYSLRHTFQTVAEGARDLAAVQSIMGHAPAANDMSATYRERISDERLTAVTNYVRHWLFGDESATGTSNLTKPPKEGTDHGQI